MALEMFICAALLWAELVSIVNESNLAKTPGPGVAGKTLWGVVTVKWGINWERGEEWEMAQQVH